MEEGIHDDEFLKFFFQLELDNFKGSPAVDKNSLNLSEKKKKTSISTDSQDLATIKIDIRLEFYRYFILS